MKIKSIQQLTLPETTRHDLVLRNGNQYILTEGSVTECEDDAESKISALFAIPQLTDLNKIGLVLIEDETHYESFLEKANYGSDIDSVDNKTFGLLLSEHDESASVRTALKDALSENIKRRLGLLINAIDESYEDIEAKKLQLEAMGYDCTVCFVNIPLEETMARKNGFLNEEQVNGLWKKTQLNISRYAELFGGNIAVINGTDPDKLVESLEFIVGQVVTEPIQNPIGQNLAIRSQTTQRL